MVAGSGLVVEAVVVDAVVWVHVGVLAAYVPVGFYGPVGLHLDADLKDGRPVP